MRHGWGQMKHHQAPRCSAVSIQTIEPFGVSWISGPDQPIGRLPVAFGTAVIEIRMYWRCIIVHKPCGVCDWSTPEKGR